MTLKRLGISRLFGTSYQEKVDEAFGQVKAVGQFRFKQALGQAQQTSTTPSARIAVMISVSHLTAFTDACAHERHAATTPPVNIPHVENH
jgi:hypothetical protein